jgi:hypothetical protein
VVIDDRHAILKQMSTATFGIGPAAQEVEGIVDTFLQKAPHLTNRIIEYAGKGWTGGDMVSIAMGEGEHSLASRIVQLQGLPSAFPRPQNAQSPAGRLLTNSSRPTGRGALYHGSVQPRPGLTSDPCR